MQKYIQQYIQKHMHKYIQEYMQTYIQNYMQNYIQPYMHKYMQKYRLKMRKQHKILSDLLPSAPRDWQGMLAYVIVCLNQLAHESVEFEINWRRRPASAAASEPAASRDDLSRRRPHSNPDPA